MRRIFVFIISMVITCGLSVSYSYSQTPALQTAAPTVATPVAETAPDIVAPAEKPPVEAPVVTTRELNLPFDERKYVDPSYSNLAHLYWALGILDVNRNALIDNFITITECKMFQSYFNNDLEWREIRETTRNYLRDNYKTFPTSFKIMIPLYLGRYNYEDEYFEVDQEASAIASARNIETIYYMKAVTCGLGGEIEGYPRNLILNLNRPFSLPRLPVERELARLFLDETNSRRANRIVDPSRPIKAADNQRFAYLELMFRVHSYKDTIKTAGGTLKAIVFAQIDHIRVYADFDKEKLLYEKDMYEDDRRKHRRRTGGTTSGDLNLPEGPLFGEPKSDKK